MFKSINKFVFSSIILVSFLACTGLFVFFLYFYMQLGVEKSQKFSESIAKQVYNSMYMVMQKGWGREELLEFVDNVQNSYEVSDFSVAIHRGKLVSAQFGEIQSKAYDALVAQTFQERNNFTINENGFYRTSIAIKAKNACLSCHTNAQIGDVLGVIDIQHNYSDELLVLKEEFIVYFILSALGVLAIASLISKIVSKRVDSSIQELNQKVGEIHSVKDLARVSINPTDLGFNETNEILKNVNELTTRFKNIAVDKELLEFEVRLLNKFIITSDVIHDWKEYVNDLLIEINTVLEAYSLFSVFQVEKESYEIEIFWKATPSEEIKIYFEEVVKKTIQEHSQFEFCSQISINHNIIQKHECLEGVTKEDIQTQVKSLLLETPKIGGVVGIGVQSELTQDPVRYIIIDSVLTTLINLVGSVKAIYKFTKELEYYATRDPLTGLLNQRVFRDLLEYEIERSKKHEHSFALLVIDFDNFKTINDRYGHSFGDRFLCDFGDLLKKSLRPEDMVARYGGDEFAVILPETDVQTAYMLSKHVVDKMEKLVLHAENNDRVSATVSIGAAEYPVHAKNAKELFVVADTMMYKVKHEGKHGVCFPSQDDVEDVIQTYREKSVIVSKALDNNKIIPYFQPIVDPKNQTLQIHELLMRIELEDGIMNAGEFIDIAESMGVVHRLDYILIEKAFEHMNKIGYRDILFINLSPKALIISEFIDKVIVLAQKYNIIKSNIVFEITERETVKSFAMLEKFVQKLKLEGFKFAIDDFGSGFSSFHYIKKFPIDYIKIEGDFIRNMTNDKKDFAFVQSIVSLAKHLQIKTVAEFVEDAEVCQAICDLDIDYAQGYYISKPQARLSSIKDIEVFNKAVDKIN